MLSPNTNWESWRRLFGVDTSDVSLKWSFATWSVFLSSAWNLEQRIVEPNVLLDTLSAPKPSHTSKGKRCQLPNICHFKI